MLTKHLQYAFCTMTLLNNRQYEIFPKGNRAANKQSALKNFKELVGH